MEVFAQRVCVCARAHAHALGDFIISRDSCVPVHSPPALLAFLFYRSIYSQEAGMVFPPPAIFFLRVQNISIAISFISPCSCPLRFLLGPVSRCAATELNHSPESHSCFCFKEEPFSSCYMHFSEL